MNIPSLLILIGLVSLTVFIAVRSLLRLKQRHGHCESCGEEDCQMRDLMTQINKKKHSINH